MKSILVVDDSDLIRLKVRQILEKENYKVFEASNPATVRNNSFTDEKYSLQDIDLVLLDIYLKEKNGLNLLKYLVNNFPSLPVIMVSIESKREIVLKSLEIGALDYLLKPFDKRVLVERIQHLIHSSKNNKKISSERKNSNKLSENWNNLKTTLTREINRSLRSELPFSLIKLDFSKNTNKKLLDKIKELLTISIRDIDQVFPLAQKNYVLLLPLTDKKGSQVLLNRLSQKTEDQLTADDTDVNIQILTFPNFIKQNSEEKIDFKHINNYRNQILNEF